MQFMFGKTSLASSYSFFLILLLLLKTTNLTCCKHRLQGHVTVKTYSALNKYVFKCFLKARSDDALTMVGGSLFQTRAAVAPKARSPTIFSLVRGTISLCIDDDRSRFRESLSAAHCKSLDKYSGAVLFRQR